VLLASGIEKFAVVVAVVVEVLVLEALELVLVLLVVVAGLSSQTAKVFVQAVVVTTFPFFFA